MQNQTNNIKPYVPKYPTDSSLNGIELIQRRYEADKVKSARTVGKPAKETEVKQTPKDAKPKKTEPVDIKFDTDTFEVVQSGKPAPRAEQAHVAKPSAPKATAKPVAPTEKTAAREKIERPAKQSTAEKKRRAEADYDEIFGVEKPQKKRSKIGTVIRRSLLVLGTVLILAVVTVYAACYTIATGPSTSVRDLLVLSALQASATKWVPGLFLDDAVVQEIWDNSQKTTVEVIDPDDIKPPAGTGTADAVDEWANAQDGMQFLTINSSTFKAYMLIVKDPSRIYVPTSCDFTSVESTSGITIFQMAEREGVVAAINAGEYVDIGGMGTGDTPIGLTYSQGKLVWNDGNYRTFIGFDNNNKLICREYMTPEIANSLGIRDAVSFQWGNVLIDNTDEGVKVYYADKNVGTAQRTAIGQRADGAVILLVTDGRTASSPGATRNDVIDIMIEYGAVSAAMLDGGSSALMYYKDYYTKYSYDTSKLDKYQMMGLVNNYKAFTTPRRMPTFFGVRPE